MLTFCKNNELARLASVNILLYLQSGSGRQPAMDVVVGSNMQTVASANSTAAAVTTRCDFIVS